MKFFKNIFQMNLLTYQLMGRVWWSLLKYSRQIFVKISAFFNMQQSVAEVRRRRQRRRCWRRRRNVDHTALLLLFHEFLERQKLSNWRGLSCQKTHSTYERCACKGHLKATATGIRHDGHHRATGGHSKTTWANVRWVGRKKTAYFCPCLGLKMSMLK